MNRTYGEFCASPSEAVKLTVRHRWGEKNRLEHKTEQTCTKCEIGKVTHHQCEGGRDIYWTEFYRGLDKIEGSGTPVCEPVATPSVVDHGVDA